ncbi:NAD(P)-binding protein [Leucogyrophana mollusca]|uniref:NAD(P)-binding protein n=1 Tax=Leucogyrophana mollusca TaxID=85980 RepID=A0ACB8BZ51_9AGAM|nr:NAD(P)-binding protein [Leucogyrophana mollusca]
MPAGTYTQIVLRERPVADILPDTFEVQTKSLVELKPGPGQALVRVTYLSLDPAMRGWLRDARSYLPPVKIGEVMRASGLGVVVKSGQGSRHRQGDLVLGAFGWTEYAIMNDKALEKIVPPPGSTPLDFLGTLGMPGMTAFFGLNDIGQLKAGETLVVSGAAGAVGSLVCQLGKKAGARVVAIAGSPDKCAWLESELEVDKALNYKSPSFRKDFKESVGYLDVYFDNVGGEILDMALSRLNRNARIVLCGAISAYNTSTPRGLMAYQNLISQRAKIQGFVVFDYASQYARARAEIASGLANGSIKRKFHIIEGLENAPKALPMLFSGGNTGKLVVKVSNEGPQVPSKL